MSAERPQSAADVVAGLRVIADRLAGLGDAPLPDVFVSINIQPSGGEEVEVAAIDLLGRALFGRPGDTRQMSSGSYHHSVSGPVASISVAAFGEVASSAERELRAELEQLRAQLAVLVVDQPSDRRADDDVCVADMVCGGAGHCDACCAYPGDYAGEHDHDDCLTAIADAAAEQAVIR